VLRFKAAGSAESRAFLPVEATDALVVATDQRGNPAIVVKSHGRGQTVLCTYPLEYLAAAQGRVNPEDTYRLYDALAVVAGVERPVRVADPMVLVDSLVHEDGREFVFVVSQHSTPVTVTPSVTSGGLVALDGAPVGSVSIDPYGVVVLRRA